MAEAEERRRRLARARLAAEAEACAGPNGWPEQAECAERSAGPHGAACASGKKNGLIAALEQQIADIQAEID